VFAFNELNDDDDDDDVEVKLHFNHSKATARTEIISS